MRIEPRTGLTIDIHKRFKTSCRGLPDRVRLEGNPMQAAIAERLLRRHRPHTSIGEGTTVVLCSQETYTSRLLESMLTGAPPPKGPFLLHTIPEELLISFAARHNIPIIREEKSDVRRMVERIAKEQPQTFFSLARSMGRLGIVPDTDE